MPVLNVGLNSWIIQDGNYDDFEVDHESRFALEFQAARFDRTLDPRKYLKPLSGTDPDYRFCGEIIVSEAGLTVLDVGVLCYRERNLPMTERFAAGELYLGIDFFLG